MQRVIPKTFMLQSLDGETATDLEIVEACHRFLEASSDHSREPRDWSVFAQRFLGHKDNYVNWLGCQCVATVTGMTDTQREALVSRHLAPCVAQRCLLQLERQTALEVPDKEQDQPGSAASDTCVAGIWLPVFDSAWRCDGFLVPVDSMKENLRRLAQAVVSGRAICLQGPVGCGKTALVEHLAQLIGRVQTPHFVKVQLGDQTDSKMLLGLYRCTDVPGEFVWQPGVLTQAVVGGHWLLLEDVDSAAQDVLSVLTSLMDTGSLTVPGYRDSVKVAPGFQLFVTRRLVSSNGGFHRQSTGACKILEKRWQQINVEPLSKEELIQVVKEMFPVLGTIATRIVDLFLLFSLGDHAMPLGSKESGQTSIGGRLTSTRDLLKLCSRAVEDFDVSSSSSAMKVFQDAIDIFCCSIVKMEERVRLATAVGTCLGIVRAKAEYICKNHKPCVDLSLESFTVGRVSLPRLQEGAPTLASSDMSSFTFTRPAACLLERIACCVNLGEPVLLVGETGTGKTKSVQYLAERTGHRLVVINMNQQSDSTDLLGGYKPVDVKFIVSPVREEFERLFRNYFSVGPNAKFLEHVATCFNSRRWTALVKLMRHSQVAALKHLDEKKPEDAEQRVVWSKLGDQLERLESQLKGIQSTLAFSFIEGSLVKALRNGWWVLLDEINLASAETLECLSGLLEGSAGSLSLLERGDREPVVRHHQFRLFACMNPATDVGKKDLPAGLRNRFTELFVDELTEVTDLLLLTGTYLQSLCLPANKLESLVKFYLRVKKEAVVSLTDGTGHKPHYSLRTLCRALSVASRNACYSVLRSLYEALCLSFLTQLDRSSHPAVEQLVFHAVFGKSAANTMLKQPIPQPISLKQEEYVCFEGYWVPKGKLKPNLCDKYVLTPCVRRNLRDLVRVVSLGRHPVLLQGETSVGKTSLVMYLAQASGNPCLRVNNHEHTDLQEYVGSYCADPEGRLVFKEGVLVEAMRKGYWIILDELNLAPTDVLEALNRVLDDNRELFIPETQETIKADPNFMLFATQNPPGHYGGRKMLSRAFRNRFVELHFDEIPAVELETILHERCDMPSSYCKKLVAVMMDLQLRRRGSAAFAGKQGFMTLRDLFRWAERYRLASAVGTRDWDQQLADEGFLVLAGRVRRAEECDTVREALKRHIKREVDPRALFTLGPDTSEVTRAVLGKVLGSEMPPGFQHIVWTYEMRRLAVLVGKAFEYKEPVLLVGHTGCGKTTVCQLLATLQNQKLHTVNCHMHTESSDFLGGLRPVRDHTNTDGPQKLFEWVDGPLVNAMRAGDLFLADEISLADDSVLERLNSLLEPERKLLLSEKGCGEESFDQSNSSCVVVAQGNFHFIGTMNPGGDYGKKELSPALRNRFTEIWCEGSTGWDDLLAVVEHNLKPGLSLGNQQDGSSGLGHLLLDFVVWFSTCTDMGKRLTVSIRDILSWVNFINVCTEEPGALEGSLTKGKLDLPTSYVHGAELTFLDSLGSGSTSGESTAKINALVDTAIQFLTKQLALTGDEYTAITARETSITDTHFGIHPFYIDRGPGPIVPDTFSFLAPTTGSNALRVLRGLQLDKPILLEGSPGVGKTSLVVALAKAAGHRLVRINVSDQTDVSDLFGSDLPVEGGEGGQFAWRDGPFLQALRAGHWVLLDELNLASQSVLEGLNACLDHRGEVFIPELGKTFHVKTGQTRLFGAQNPLRQGGARRGLPQSFLNRFTQVYIDSLTEGDLQLIVGSLFPMIPRDLVFRMVRFNSRLARETGELRLWGHRGSPWELNLRDVCRWCEAMVRQGTAEQPSTWKPSEPSSMDTSQVATALNPGSFVGLIYVDRMRTREDKEKVEAMYVEEFGDEFPLPGGFQRFYVTREALYVGSDVLSRTEMGLERSCARGRNNLLVLRKQLAPLQSLIRCVNMNWLAILVGASGSGKTSVVRMLSQLSGRELRVLSVNSAMDTTEILGGFEQADYNRHLEEIASKAERVMLDVVRRRLLDTSTTLKKCTSTACQHWKLWETYSGLCSQQVDVRQTMSAETELFHNRLSALRTVLESLKLDPHTAIEELRVLLDKLRTLEANVRKEGNLNAGGKFEWVDSVLVKCLLDGCWLMVDNVNLCSPAVLDRLNALLEPGGVLTIGERGVGPTGELVTIKPHPHFRLFLVMDPCNGEISRAMRNRGVEICLLGKEEIDPQPLDKKSILAMIGLKHSFQMRLFTLHTAFEDVSTATEMVDASHLFQAASLIVQRVQSHGSNRTGPIARVLSHGSNLREAFIMSGSDVYIRSRAGLPLERRRELDQVMNDALESWEAISNQYGYQDFPHLVDMTLRTSSIQGNSSLAFVKEQGSLVSTLLHLGQESTDPFHFLQRSSTRTLNILLGLSMSPMHYRYQKKNCIVDALQILPFAVYMFYETATLDDVQFRSEWLQDAIIQAAPPTSGQNSSIVKDSLEKVLKLSSVLCQCLQKNSLNGSRQGAEGLPWDIRWLPQLENALRRTLTEQQLQGFASAANKQMVLLRLAYFKLMHEEQTPSQHSKVLKSSSLSVLEYSSAVVQGKLSRDATDHPIASKFSTLLLQLDACLELVLESPETQLETQEALELLAALEWRFRFRSLGKLWLFENAGGLQPLTKAGKLKIVMETVSKLNLHFKWLHKWLLPHVHRLVSQVAAIKESETVCNLMGTLALIERSLATSLSPLFPIAKKSRFLLGQPEPLESLEDAVIAQRLERVSKALDVWFDYDPAHTAAHEVLLSYHLTKVGGNAAFYLNFARYYLPGGNYKSLEDNLEKLEKHCAQLGLLKSSLPIRDEDKLDKFKEILTDRKIAANSAKVQLWPVRDLMCLLLSGAFRRNFVWKLKDLKEPLKEQIFKIDQGGNTLPEAKRIAGHLGLLMGNLPCIPTELSGMVAKVGSSPMSEAGVDGPRLTMLLLRHCQLSPAVNRVKEWVAWIQEDPEKAQRQKKDYDWLQADKEPEEILPLHCPLLSMLVTLTVQPDPKSSDGVATCSLVAHAARERQLAVLQEIIWRNMAILASPQLNIKSNDAQHVEAAIHRFLDSLRVALAVTYPDNTLNPLVRPTIMCKVAWIMWRLHRQTQDKMMAKFTGGLTILAVIAGNLEELQKDSKSDVAILVETGKAWTYVGLLQVMLFANLGICDPVTKKALKLPYISKELVEIERRLYVHEMRMKILGVGFAEPDPANQHPSVVTLKKKRAELIGKECDLRYMINARPNPPLFDALAKETQHYVNSLSSSETVLNLYNRLLNAIKELSEGPNIPRLAELMSNAKGALREEKTWQESQSRFCDQLESQYGVWYRDMVTPLVSAATQLCHGVRLLASTLRKVLVRAESGTRSGLLLRNLVRFPTLGENQPVMVNLAYVCVSPETTEVIKRALGGTEEGEQPPLYRQESYRLLKCGLEELRNQVAVRGEVEPLVWGTLLQILDQVVAAWRQQECEAKRKKEEQDSMYLMRGATRCKTLTDDEEALLEVEEIFPSSEELDFGDLQPPSLEQIQTRGKAGQDQGENSGELAGLITREDIDEICMLHSQIVEDSTGGPWLAPSSSSIKPDYVGPLLRRYKTFGLLLDRTVLGLDSSLDQRLSPSLALLTSVTLNLCKGVGQNGNVAGDMPSPGSPAKHGATDTARSYDFYRDSHVWEVKQCLPTLELLAERVAELQALWPDHPTLQQIRTIMERVQNFPITSAVSRFLTGFELLLAKLNEWEENAHVGVSLADQSATITHQIVAWRKLELQCWKDCLSNAARSMKMDTSKWWFYMYALVDQYLASSPSTETGGTSAMLPHNLIKTLQRFMEESTLGEFEARLNLLFAFHCHTLHFNRYCRREELANILWNIHSYYRQFSESIAAKIKELRSPIEKKLKDFVKIARWNDISYWAIKQAVDKTHRTLHKYIKEFQGVLKQPVIGALVSPKSEPSEVHEGVWDRPQRYHPRQYQYLLEPLHFIANTKLKKLTVFEAAGEPVEKEGLDLLPRAGSLFVKSRRLSKETILSSSYPRLVQNLDSLITMLFEMANHLRTLEVSKDAPKSKQKSQAKSILQQKRKGLADFFQILRKLGLSYRTGIVGWDAVRSEVTQFTIPPLDLKAAFQRLKARRVDSQLLTVWDGCETYFLRSVARFAALNCALRSPSKDLGPPTIERCRGFSAHLMILAQEQKLELEKSTRHLCLLRCQLAQLTTMEDTEVSLPKQSVLQYWMERLRQLLVTFLTCMEQFRIFMHTCPSEDLSAIKDLHVPILKLDIETKLPPMVGAIKEDENWNKTIKTIKSLITGALKLKSTLEKSEIPCAGPPDIDYARVGTPTTFQAVSLISSAQYELLVTSFTQMETFALEIGEMCQMFMEDIPGNVNSSFEATLSQDRNPMIDSMAWLRRYIRSESSQFFEATSYIDVPICKKGVIYTLNSEKDLMGHEIEFLSSPMDVEGRESQRGAAGEAGHSVRRVDAIVDRFRTDAEALLRRILLVIQKKYKKYMKQNAEALKVDHVQGGKDEGEEGEETEMGEIEPGQLKRLVVEALVVDIAELDIINISKKLYSLLVRLMIPIDEEGDPKQLATCKRLLLCCLPCLEQLALLCQFFVTQQVAAHRVSCKLLSISLSLFIDLVQQGFCTPPEIATEGEEDSQMENAAGGMGLGEGEGEKDVSETVESEDQLEEARPQGEERKEDDKDCKEEEKGVETSEDFGGNVQDLEDKEDDEESDESEDETDTQMGETEAGADKLDQQIWGSDSEEEGEGEENEGEEKGSGEKVGEPELGAKDDKSKPGDEEEDGNDDKSRKEEKKKDINEMEEPDENDDQVDPYHGNQQPLPEPEPFELPEDMQLDDGEGKDGEEEGEENPFEIDAMKEQKPPDAGEEEKATEDDKQDQDLSDDEVGENEDDKEGGESMETEEMQELEDKDEPMQEESGGSKDEEKEGDKAKEEKTEEEEAKPSEDQASQDEAESAAQMEKDSSKDQVSAQTEDQNAAGQQPDEEEANPEGGEEKQGVGQSRTEEPDPGHRGRLAARRDQLPSNRQDTEEENRKRQPGETDGSRTLGDVNEPLKKKLKTMNMPKKDDVAVVQKEDAEEEEEEEGAERGEKGDVYQHIKEAKQKFDAQTLDAATKEQAEKQAVPSFREDDDEEWQDADEMDLQEDEIMPDEDKAPEQPAERLPGEKKQGREKGKPQGEEGEEGEIVEIEGEKIETQGAARGSETTFHTKMDQLEMEQEQPRVTEETLQEMRLELEGQLASWSQPPANAEAEKAWEQFTTVTSELARDLSEQLRLILEPTQASRLRGDYRTGRRINMRKVIPYIASQFRKDKIWMRRTKPCKRDYQIALAIDDSSSMADNHSRELAFESLALVSRALTLLEAGELSVISFGDEPRVLHPPGDPFTEQSGARLLQQFSFEQKSTKVGRLVDFACTLLSSSCERLLIIVSDGRGVLSEGADKVKQAVRRARQAGIFMVFVIVDNPDTKDSILDIRMPIFKDGKLLGIPSYLDNFPFPFYLILRNINALPAVLSDALRQWFELVTNTDS